MKKYFWVSGMWNIFDSNNLLSHVRMILCKLHHCLVAADRILELTTMGRARRHLNSKVVHKIIKFHIQEPITTSTTKE